MSESRTPLFEIRVGVFYDKTQFCDVVEAELRNYDAPDMGAMRYIRRYVRPGEFVDDVVNQAVAVVLTQARR